MIHKSAVIQEGALIDKTASVGAFSYIGRNVNIGKNTVIYPNVYIEGNTTIGDNCKIYPFTTIGTNAQDLSVPQGFTGNVIIKNNVILREQVSVHASTSEESSTLISDGCYLMATSHVAHDCFLDNSVIMANSSMLAGHASVGKCVFISGGAAIHQHLKIGKYAFVIACSRTVQDVPPYCMTAGSSPVEFAGLNIIGLRRAGFSPDERSIIKKSYQILYKKGMKTNESLGELLSLNHPISEEISDFVKTSKRGIIRKWNGRHS
jgi:UDP-N-acetylglucosamine acyltransferase